MKDVRRKVADCEPIRQTSRKVEAVLQGDSCGLSRILEMRVSIA